MRLDDDFFADADADEGRDGHGRDTAQPRHDPAPTRREAAQPVRDPAQPERRLPGLAPSARPRGAPVRRPPRPPAPRAGSDAGSSLRERLGKVRAASVAARRDVTTGFPPPTESVVEPSGDGRPPRPILRSEVHHHRVSLLGRLRSRISDALTSPAELAEYAEDRRLARLPSTSRTNLIVFVGPRGGVGKTTVARAVGGLLSAARCGTVILMDADRDYGPAGDLAPDSRRSSKTLSDLLADFDAPPHPPQLRPYLSTLDDGLLILSAPSTRAEMRALTPEHYERALGLLRGADVVLMDCAGGIGDLQEWALRVADQAVVFATPDFVAANNVAKVLTDPDVGLPHRSTLVLNNPRPEGAGDMSAIEQHFARHSLEERVVLPYDQRLRVMLDQGTYDLECLDRSTRVPLKRLAAAVGEGLL
jgi:MinD-like ATPase involved in chromosome partitioning or flagellar assembly